MGRLFLEHLGGTRLFSCTNCDVFLTNRSELVSTRFTGATGRAFLFNKVVNLDFGEVQDRIMLTGRHMVRDVSCKKCKVKLGWMYEFATDESQRYKEGRVILERALITESEGFPENVVKNQETDTSSASQTVYKECFRMIETVNGNTYFLFTVQTKTKSYTIDELDVTLIDGLDHWNCKIENEMLKSLASQSGLCLLDYAEVLLSALCDEITAEGNDDVKTAFLYDVAFGSQYCQLSWKQKLSNCTFYHLGTATLTKIGTAEVVSSLQRLYNFSFREITNLKETLHSLETTCERLKQERSQAFALTFNSQRIRKVTVQVQLNFLPVISWHHFDLEHLHAQQIFSKIKTKAIRIYKKRHHDVKLLNYAFGFHLLLYVTLMAQKKLNLIVQNFCGSALRFCISSSSTVLDLKCMIHKRIGLDPELQNLSIGETILSDDSLLKDCGIGNNDTLLLTIKIETSIRGVDITRRITGSDKRMFRFFQNGIQNFNSTINDLTSLIKEEDLQNMQFPNEKKGVLKLCAKAPQDNEKLHNEMTRQLDEVKTRRTMNEIKKKFQRIKDARAEQISDKMHPISELKATGCKKTLFESSIDALLCNPQNVILVGTKRRLKAASECYLIKNNEKQDGVSFLKSKRFIFGTKQLKNFDKVDLDALQLNVILLYLNKFDKNGKHHYGHVICCPMSKHNRSQESHLPAVSGKNEFASALKRKAVNVKSKKGKAFRCRSKSETIVVEKTTKPVSMFSNIDSRLYTMTLSGAKTYVLHMKTILDLNMRKPKLMPEKSADRKSAFKGEHTLRRRPKKIHLITHNIQGKGSPLNEKLSLQSKDNKKCCCKTRHSSSKMCKTTQRNGTAKRKRSSSKNNREKEYHIRRKSSKGSNSKKSRGSKSKRRGT
ncbi:Protein yippee-like 5 [Trichinella britovi]|uniref:Protein yippee-like 5 n=1 Tax=Trichinella britovi TaxID=45882 RepID=A0A0V1CQ21_TRIBR|nr:Protein yippee-like 5 [Trichinella britovi]